MLRWGRYCAPDGIHPARQRQQGIRRQGRGEGARRHHASRLRRPPSACCSARRAAANRPRCAFVAGLESASAGQVFIDGREVTHAAAVAARHRDGVPELRPVPAPIRGRQHRLRPAGAQSRQSRGRAPTRTRGRSARLDFAAATQALAAVGRAAAARRARPARWWRRHACAWMDEPLSNLDAQLRQEMRHELRELQQRLGLTVVYVTHDQAEAMSMADQVVLLNQGRVEQDAAPRDALREAGLDVCRALHRHTGDEPGQARRRRAHRRQRHRGVTPGGHARHPSRGGVARRSGACHRQQLRIPRRRSWCCAAPSAASRSWCAPRAAPRCPKAPPVTLGWRPGRRTLLRRARTTRRLTHRRQGEPAMNQTVVPQAARGRRRVRRHSRRTRPGTAAHRDLVLFPGGRGRPDHQDHRRLRHRLLGREPRRQGDAHLRRQLPGHDRQGADGAQGRQPAGDLGAAVHRHVHADRRRRHRADRRFHQDRRRPRLARQLLSGVHAQQPQRRQDLGHPVPALDRGAVLEQGAVQGRGAGPQQAAGHLG